jgi:3-oxoacyl-[acyl-carrier protein] reductase
MLSRIAYSDMTDEQYDAVMNFNARSVVAACRYAIPWLRKSGGCIINTPSVAALAEAPAFMALQRPSCPM